MPSPSDRFSLNRRVVAVIGAGSGIGEAVARGLAGQGAHVVCLDVAADAAAATAARIRQDNGLSEADPLDIVDRAAVDACFERIVKERGSVDGVVCTPAINVRKKILDYSDDEFELAVRRSG